MVRAAKRIRIQVRADRGKREKPVLAEEEIGKRQGKENEYRVGFLSVLHFFSRDEATLYEGVSVRPSFGRMDGWMVGP